MSSKLFVFIGLLLGVMTALADSHESTSTGSVAETFVCNFNSGKDADDLWSAVEYWQLQASKSESKDVTDYFSAVIQPLRSSIPGDYAWIGYWSDLNAMTRGLTDWYASGAGQSADARFDTVGKCRSNTWLREPLMTNFPEDDATPMADAIEIHLCTLRDSATMASVKAAEQGFMDAYAEAAIAVDRWTPLFATTPYDLAYLVAHEDLLKLGSFNTARQTSAIGQANLAAFAASLNCESGLYTARVVQQGTAE